MLSELQQEEVSQETDCVCLCGTDLGNWPAQLPGRAAQLQPFCHQTPGLGQAFITLGAALPSRNKGDSCPCLVMYRDIDVMQCPILGSSVFPRVEKCWLCGREYFLQTSTKFLHFTLLGISIRKIRLEGGSLEWFWEALTQKGENDSYYYCYLLRRTDHEPDLLLIFGNLKHLCSDPKRVCGFEPRSFNIKAKSQLWELAHNILRRFICITIVLDKYFNILSASLLCLWNEVVNKCWNLTLCVLWQWSVYL